MANETPIYGPEILEKKGAVGAIQNIRAIRKSYGWGTGDISRVDVGDITDALNVNFKILSGLGVSQEEVEGRIAQAEKK